MCGEFFVFKDVFGDASGIHGGILEKLEPAVRPGLESKLPGPGAKSFLVARGTEDFAFNLAPVARGRGHAPGRICKRARLARSFPSPDAALGDGDVAARPSLPEDIQSSLCDDDANISIAVGWKPTATIVVSLRDWRKFPAERTRAVALFEASDVIALHQAGHPVCRQHHEAEHKHAQRANARAR
jgi:hypothetical protein